MSNRRTFCKTALSSGFFAGSLLRPMIDLTSRADEPSTAVQKQRPIRIAQIGTRHGHAAGQMATLRRFPERFEVVGWVEPDDQRRARLRRQAPYRGVADLTEQALAKLPKVEAVAIETDVPELLPTARRWALRDVHIFLDKPPGDALPDFEQLVREMDSRGRVLQLGYMLRYNPAVKFTFRAVKLGWLGKIYAIHAEMSKRVSDADRAPLARFPGGAMFELGCHLIDPIAWLLGRPTSVACHALQTRPDDELDDHVVAVLDYPAANVVVRSAVCEVGGFDRRQFVVMGTKGKSATHFSGLV